MLLGARMQEFQVPSGLGSAGSTGRCINGWLYGPFQAPNVPIRHVMGKE